MFFWGVQNNTKFSNQVLFLFNLDVFLSFRSVTQFLNGDFINLQREYLSNKLLTTSRIKQSFVCTANLARYFAFYLRVDSRKWQMEDSLNTFKNYLHRFQTTNVKNSTKKNRQFFWKKARGTPSFFSIFWAEFFYGIFIFWRLDRIEGHWKTLEPMSVTQVVDFKRTGRGGSPRTRGWRQA